MLGENESPDLKEILVSKGNLVSGVLFHEEFDKVDRGYKELWHWMVTKALPKINDEWRLRVSAGGSGVNRQKPIMDIVTESDIALLFTLLEWGQKEWVPLFVLAHKKPDAVDPVSDPVTGVPVGIDCDEGEEEDDPTLSSGGVQSGLSSLGLRGAEDGLGRRGRKSGQEIFGSNANVEIFNKHAFSFEKYLEDPAMAEKRKVWFDRPLMWVNHKMMGPLDNDPEACNGRMLIETAPLSKATVVPFVSKRRIVAV
jgi:hypothetical protein